MSDAHAHRTVPTLLAAALVTLVAAHAVSDVAAATDLDLRFGTFGQVLTRSGGSQQAGTAIVRQADGKLVVAGYLDDRMSLLRYDAGGTLDPSFGTSGLVTTDFGGAPSRAIAVAVQADGKLIAAGDAGGWPGTDVALTRYESTGALDTGFGIDGLVRTTVGTTAYASAILVQPDDTIVVAGKTDDGIVVVRYLGDGNLDPAFGTGGIVTTHLAGLDAYVYAAVRQPDGMIVVAGSVKDEDAGTAAFVLARYDATGTLDPSFGAGGVAIGDFSANFVTGRALVRQPDGSLVVGGGVGVGNSIDFALARFDANGVPAPSFGTGGVAFGGFATDSQLAFGFALASDAEGKLVLAGLAGPHFALARFDADGILDPSFGDGGRLRTPAPDGSGAVAYGLVVTPDGGIVAAGYSVGNEAGYPDGVVLARYGRSCSATPLAGCRPTAGPGAAKLALARKAAPAANKLAFKWRAAATTAGDFGDPAGDPGHDYVACLYDESGTPALLAHTTAPAAVVCGAKPCWKSTAKSARFRNPVPSDGTQSLKLAASGNEIAKLEASVKSRHLGLPVLPLKAPVALRLQLQAGTGECWDATFSASGIKRNDPGSFSAKSD